MSTPRPRQFDVVWERVAVTDPALVAAGTSEGAIKAWDKRGRLGSGTRHYWALSEGALAIAEQAHAIVNDDADEHSGAQWRDMATEIMDAIDAQPAKPAKLFSGQTAMSAPEVGEEVVLPILSVSPSLGLAQAYAGKQAGMADPRGTPDDQLLWSQMRPEIRDMIGRGMDRKVSSAAEESPRLIYHFADTRSVPVRDNERLVSGRYTVTAVREGDPIPDAWVYDFELHDLRQKHYTEVDLAYTGPARTG